MQIRKTIFSPVIQLDSFHSGYKYRLLESHVVSQKVHIGGRMWPYSCHTHTLLTFAQNSKQGAYKET